MLHTRSKTPAEGERANLSKCHKEQLIRIEVNGTKSWLFPHFSSILIHLLVKLIQTDTASKLLNSVLHVGMVTTPFKQQCNIAMYKIPGMLFSVHHCQQCSPLVFAVHSPVTCRQWAGTYCTVITGGWVWLRPVGLVVNMMSTGPQNSSSSYQMLVVKQQSTMEWGYHSGCTTDLQIIVQMYIHYI